MSFVHLPGTQPVHQLWKSQIIETLEKSKLLGKGGPRALSSIRTTAAPSHTMNHNSQPFFLLTTLASPHYEGLKEDLRGAQRSCTQARHPRARLPWGPPCPTFLVRPPCPTTWSGPCSTQSFWTSALGFVALTHSMKSRNQKVVGDMMGTQVYASIPSAWTSGPWSWASFWSLPLLLFLPLVHKWVSKHFQDHKMLWRLLVAVHGLRLSLLQLNFMYISVYSWIQ